MKVLAEQCATCIFRPGNPMKLKPGRVRQMVADCQRMDTHIPCHEYMTTQEDDEDGTMNVADIESPVCRGFYDRYPGVGQMIRISQRLGMWEEVSKP